MNYADIEYNEILGSTIHMFATKYPSIPAASEKIMESEVPGRDGKLHRRSGCYSPTEIAVEFNYIGKDYLWNERWRKAKEWLSATNAKLKIGDDTNYFYKISHVVIAQNERMSSRVGKFTAVFVTKDGLMYLEDGLYEQEIEQVKYNPGIISHPEYHIEGEGVCEVVVNGKIMKANVSGNIIINTELMLSYKADKTAQNTVVSGDYEDLYLQSGENEISVTDGFACKIIPNWRYL